MKYTLLVNIGEQFFKVISCQKAASVKRGRGELHEERIKKLFEPLILENRGGDFIQNIESKTKSFVSGLFNLPDGQEKVMDFEDSSGKEYTALFQMVRSSEIFAFLLLPLSDNEVRELERTAVRKSYMARYAPDEEEPAPHLQNSNYH